MELVLASRDNAFFKRLALEKIEPSILSIAKSQWQQHPFIASPGSLNSDQYVLQAQESFQLSAARPATSL